MAHSHVPEFGNWDNDNDQYTACFENARKEKAGFMTNPNDPEENLETFNLYMRDGQNVDADAAKASLTYSHNASSLEKTSHGVGAKHARRHSHHNRRGSEGSFTADFASERSDSDYSVIQRHPKSHHKSSMSKGSNIVSSSSSSSHNRHRSKSQSFNDHKDHEATAIPIFGAWDVTDPRSGEGYTAIFSKIKEERQIASGQIPPGTPSLNNCSNIQNQCDGPCSVLSKYCCCFFSSESTKSK